MKQTIFIFLIILSCSFVHPSTLPGRIIPELSSRVDTADSEVMAIVKLYENYLNSRPDSIYDNPYWNQVEKDLYADFDFSRQSLFQGGLTPDQLCQLYPPFVMSVEPIGAKYQIRIMFSSNTTDPQYTGSKVWCIQKLNAIKENGRWVLENLLVELSQKWERQTVGYVDYVYPRSHEFDLDEARKGQEFCEDIVTRFNPGYNAAFSYFVTSSIDDMGLLENFDYYFVGSTTGKARESMILTAKGNESYPHEFVHKLLPENPNRGLVIEEGLATFLGTKENEEEHATAYMSKLAYDLENNVDKINFKSVVSQEVRFNGYQTAYAAGAALCELVYNERGDEGIRELIEADTQDYDQIRTALQNITGLSDHRLDENWKEVLMKYSIEQR